MDAQIKSSTLSDGSKVYDVLTCTMDSHQLEMQAKDLQAAKALVNALENCCVGIDIDYFYCSK